MQKENRSNLNENLKPSNILGAEIVGSNVENSHPTDFQNFLLIFQKERYDSTLDIYFESKTIKCIRAILEFVSFISEDVTFTNFMAKSNLIFKLFEISTYFIPKELRHSSKFQQANYELMDIMSKISRACMTSIRKVTIICYQASLLHGISDFSVVTEEIESKNKIILKDTAQTLKFKEPKQLEFFLGTLIEFFGEYYIRSIIKSYFEEELFDQLREEIVSKSEKSDYQLNEGIIQEMIAISRQRFLDKVEKLPEDAEMIGFKDLNERRSFYMKTDVMVCGVSLSSYIINPIEIKDPTSFLNEATVKLIEFISCQDFSHSVMILKGMLSLLRDNPDFIINLNSVMNLCKVYTEANVLELVLEIRDKICDIFIAICILIKNRDQNVIPFLFRKLIF